MSKTITKEEFARICADTSSDFVIEFLKGKDGSSELAVITTVLTAAYTSILSKKLFSGDTDTLEIITDKE